MAKKITLDYLYVGIHNGIDDSAKIGIAEEVLDRIDGHLSSNPVLNMYLHINLKIIKLLKNVLKLY